MSENHSNCCRDRGLEAAINPNDLRIKGSCKIYEQASTGGFDEVPSIEYPDTFAATNKMIQTDQSWFVEFKWKVFGPLACLLDGGKWKTKVILEWMGGSETNLSPEATVQDVGYPGHEYVTRLQVQPYALQPGVYRVTCCLQYYLQNGSPGPIAAFHDQGLIKIYQNKRVRTHANGAATNAPVTIS